MRICMADGMDYIYIPSGKYDIRISALDNNSIYQTHKPDMSFNPGKSKNRCLSGALYNRAGSAHRHLSGSLTGAFFYLTHGNAQVGKSDLPSLLCCMPC